MLKRRMRDACFLRYADRGRIAIIIALFIVCATVAVAVAENGGSVGGPAGAPAPFALANITADVVAGFYYPAETTVTVEVFDGALKKGTTAIRTQPDGSFEARLGEAGVDIKNGDRVSMQAQGQSQSGGFTTNLSAAADFNTGVVSGKTGSGNPVMVSVNPYSATDGTYTITNADEAGLFRTAFSLRLDDAILVSSLHPDGNITQLEIVYGTTSRALSEPILYAGDSGASAGDVEIREIRPMALGAGAGANEVAIEILTPGVSFAQAPRAVPSRLRVANAIGALSPGSTAATWQISQPTTTTAGVILLNNIKFDVDTATAAGPVELRVSGSAGVTTEPVSNARVLVPSGQTNYRLDVTALDTETADGLKSAKVRVLKGDGVLMSQITSPSGASTFNLPAGAYTLYITRAGFEATRAAIELTENTSTAVRLARSDIGVFVPDAPENIAYERIEASLEELGYRVSIITEDDLGQAQLLADSLKSLFINSSTATFTSEQVSAVRSFVRGGGSLYASDTSFNLIQNAFPGRVTFKPNPWVTVDNSVTAVIKDKGFADYLNPSNPPASLTLNTGGQTLIWACIEQATPGVELYLSGPASDGAGALNNRPLAAAFDEGAGRVLYTSYYANPQEGAVDGNGRTLLRYLALSTLSGKRINALKAQLAADGYSMEKVNIGTPIGGDTSTAYTFNVASGRDVAVRLGWRDQSDGGKNAAYRLWVRQSDSTLREETANQSPVAVVSTDAPSGVWTYSAVGLDGGEAYPYVIVVGTQAATPPMVTGTSPANNSVNVAKTAAVRVTFSENITPGTHYGGVSLKYDGSLTETFTPSISEKALTLTVQGGLREGKVYTVTVPAGAIADTAGNPLPGQYAFSFAVAAAHDPGNGGGSSSGGGAGSSGGGSGGSPGTDQPPQPIGLKAEIADGKVTLMWNAASARSSQDIAGYNVYRGLNAGGEASKVNNSPVASTSYVDSSVKPGAIYYYWVTTVYKDGRESARSAYVPASLVVVEPAITFRDTPAGSWYLEYVKGLVAGGVINGYADGTFRPDASITRAEFCKVVLAAVGEMPSTDTPVSFSDTPGHWASGYIEKARSLGITNGYADGTFRPDSYVTRAEICKIIAYAKRYRLAENLNTFTDCAGHWAESYIATVKENGVAGGYPDGTFKPSANASRAETCKMISIMMGTH